MHRGSVTRRGGKGEVKDKDAESGEDAETAGAPGETVAELDSSFAIACRSPMRLADSRRIPCPHNVLWIYTSSFTSSYKSFPL